MAAAQGGGHRCWLQPSHELRQAQAPPRAQPRAQPQPQPQPQPRAHWPDQQARIPLLHRPAPAPLQRVQRRALGPVPEAAAHVAAQRGGQQRQLGAGEGLGGGGGGGDWGWWGWWWWWWWWCCCWQHCCWQRSSSSSSSSSRSSNCSISSIRSRSSRSSSRSSQRPVNGGQRALRVQRRRQARLDAAARRLHRRALLGRQTQQQLLWVGRQAGLGLEGLQVGR